MYVCRLRAYNSLWEYEKKSNKKKGDDVVGNEEETFQKMAMTLSPFYTYLVI